MTGNEIPFGTLGDNHIRAEPQVLVAHSITVAAVAVPVADLPGFIVHPHGVKAVAPGVMFVFHYGQPTRQTPPILLVSDGLPGLGQLTRKAVHAAYEAAKVPMSRMRPVGEGQARIGRANIAQHVMGANPQDVATAVCPGCDRPIFGAVAARGGCLDCYPTLPDVGGPS